MILRFISNNRFLEIVSATDVELAQLKTVATASEYNFRLRGMDKICLLLDNKYLPGGLWKSILDLRHKNYNVSIQNLDQYLDKVQRADFDAWLERTDLVLDPYQYQMDTAFKAVQCKISKYELAPGAGKTLIIYLVCRFLLEHKKASRILIVVPSTLLVMQMPDNFDSYVEQEDVLRIDKWMGGSYPSKDSNVVIANIQIIDSLVRVRKTYLEILSLLKNKSIPRKFEIDCIKRLHLNSLGGCSIYQQSYDSLRLILHNVSEAYKTEKKTKIKQTYAKSIKVIDKLLKGEDVTDFANVIPELLCIDMAKLQSVAHALYAKLEIFKSFDACLIDECHQMKTNQHEGLVKSLDKTVTSRIIGFSGTLPKINTMDGLKIESYLGPTMHIVKHAELEELQTVSKVAIKSIEVELPECDAIKYFTNPKADDLETKYHLEQSVVRESDTYLKFVRTIAKQNKYNQFLLFSSVPFAKRAYKLFTETLLDKRVYLIIGEMPVDERRRICRELETIDDCIIIGNYQILSLGISVNNIGGTHLVDTAKSFYRVRQSIARTIRLHPNLPIANIFDYGIKLTRFDSSWPYGSNRIKNSLARHAEARRKIYDEQKMAYVEKSLTAQQVVALANMPI